MPNRLLKRIQDLDVLRDRMQEFVQGSMAKWNVQEIYADRELLVGELIPELLKEANGILQDARKAGNSTGQALMKQIGNEPTIGNVDFGALIENTIADTAADCLRLGEQYLDDLSFEAERMGNLGVSAENIIGALLADWSKRNRGPISGKVWAGFSRKLSDLAVRLYDISQNAVWFGQDLTNGN